MLHKASFSLIRKLISPPQSGNQGFYLLMELLRSCSLKNIFYLFCPFTEWTADHVRFIIIFDNNIKNIVVQCVERVI